LIKIFQHLKEKFGNIELILYGELFGGIYPHPEVEDFGILHIQKGVYYIPNIDWRCFDILVIMPDKSKKWFAFNDLQKLCADFEIPFFEQLFVGSLEECVNFDIKINSTIPAKYKLPPLKKNQIEGVIIRPFDNTQLTFPGKEFSRPIWKHKNAKFFGS